MGTFWDVMLILAIVGAGLGVGVYFLNKWAGKKMATQQDMIEKNKTPATIYVIDKKKEKASNANFPKAVTDQMPKYSKLMKLPLVKAKIGPQIMTLMCDKAVYDALPVKKTVKVEMAGMYIVGMKGLKTKREMAKFKADRKRGIKEDDTQKTGAAVSPVPWYKKIFKF
ncbi:MAG: hypothetical protein FWE82_01740 [Defluviitaleaceae bacterium]|nr:hypothetical protein [Defluviitaleaceae bacterium]